MAHHIDHVIRHNAVGWPMTGEVNPFTMSLIIYPIIITGLLLHRAGRVGPDFWAVALPWRLAAVAGTAYRPVLVGCRGSGRWAAEHAFAPLLTTDGGLDLVLAGYRVVSVLPFLAVWTALYYAFGRRLLPIMVARWVFNGGSALAVALNLVG